MQGTKHNKALTKVVGSRRFQDNVELPLIPDKRYFTIGEVSVLCGVKPHVLRYWEQEFPQIKPVKRRNRRYYQNKDILIIRHVRTLLYEKGFTIEGARAQLVSPPETTQPVQTELEVKKLIADLELVLQNLTEDIV